MVVEVGCVVGVLVLPELLLPVAPEVRLLPPPVMVVLLPPVPPAARPERGKVKALVWMLVHLSRWMFLYSWTQ